MTAELVGMIVKFATFDVTLPSGGGLKTVTLTGPVAAKSDLGTVAVSFVALE